MMKRGILITKMAKKINIGCGWNHKYGFINIDKAEEVKPDMVYDIENGLLPFKNDSVEHIYSSHCLEHVKPCNWQFVLDEIMRVAKNGCILELELPFDNSKKRGNIGHYRTFYFSSFSQYYVTEKKRAYYSDWKLKKLHREPAFIEKVIYTLFPIIKPNIKFKFEVIK